VRASRHAGFIWFSEFSTQALRQEWATLCVDVAYQPGTSGNAATQWKKGTSGNAATQFQLDEPGRLGKKGSEETYPSLERLARACGIDLFAAGKALKKAKKQTERA